MVNCKLCGRVVNKKVLVSFKYPYCVKCLKERKNSGTYMENATLTEIAQHMMKVEELEKSDKTLESIGWTILLFIAFGLAFLAVKLMEMFI